MPVIRLITKVRAPIQICFDLSRSIDLHTISTKQTGESAIAGVTSGLINLHETVTWRAKHLGVWQTLTSKITQFDQPHFFVDEMMKGAFKRFRHAHYFEEKNGSTCITDVFDYTSPFGIIGKAVDALFLKKYMTRLLTVRNSTIKEYAESDKWKTVLNLSKQE